MVALKKLPILWDKLAKQSLDDIFNYISIESPQNAKMVKKELVNLVSSLAIFPEKYSKEELLIDEPENYRSVSKWNYKIIYEVTSSAIIVVDIFQTTQNPLKINKRIKLR